MYPPPSALRVFQAFRLKNAPGAGEMAHPTSLRGLVIWSWDWSPCSVPILGACEEAGRHRTVRS